MPRKNLFEEPFDDGTIDKLSIYREYLKEWLPVFVSDKKRKGETVQIFDFFAGMGKDILGVPGSPMIAIEVIDLYKHFAAENGINIKLHLNELDKKSFNNLAENVAGLGQGFQIFLYNEPFEGVFERLYHSMMSSANFLFLDQSGIKEITMGVFARITSLSQTDFLFYISSSYFRRFAQEEEFKKYFPFEKEEIDKIDYFHIHRMVVRHYKSLIDKAKLYFLAPFSIKKGSNIYGLVFGTNHTFGMEKFLHVAWKKDGLRGDANFDIDDERIDTGKPSLFPDFDKPRKRQLFESNLTEQILSKGLIDRYGIYLYGLNEGFQFKDVNIVLRRLKAERKIGYEFELITAKLHKHTNKETLNIL